MTNRHYPSAQCPLLSTESWVVAPLLGSSMAVLNVEISVFKTGCQTRLFNVYLGGVDKRWIHTFHNDIIAKLNATNSAAIRTWLVELSLKIKLPAYLKYKKGEY